MSEIILPLYALMAFMLIAAIIAVETRDLLSSVLCLGAVGFGLSVIDLLLGDSARLPEHVLDRVPRGQVHREEHHEAHPDQNRNELQRSLRDEPTPHVAGSLDSGRQRDIVHGQHPIRAGLEIAHAIGHPV